MDNPEKKRETLSARNYFSELEGSSYKIEVNDDHQSPVRLLKGKNKLSFKINKSTGKDQFFVLKDNRIIPVQIENTGQDLNIHLGCKTTSVKVKTERDLLLEKFSTGTSQKDDQLRIVSPMPGLVTKVNASAGDKLTKGESIAIIEAMKMENEIRVPRDCKVREINVTENQAIDKGHLLAILE
ncbi:acetyl-CoA carboxylase biotin carboxyl carrier protein subunit [candidate division KSB1 bacterium]